MSPGSSSVSPASALLLILAASSAIAGGKPTSGSCNPRCCASPDVALLQEYVSGLNVTDSLLPRLEDAGSEDELLLPFGALASDWTRLLLLQKRQSSDGPLRDNLLRLSRLMLAAYFDGQEIGDWSALLNSTGEQEAGERQEGITTLGSSESGGKANDQQAHNATLDSTGQKESTWINAESSRSSSGSISTTSDNATSEPRREKPPENPATSPVFSLPANETSGSASGDNAGRSGSAGPGQKDVQSDEQQQPRLASSMELASAEGNEALHQRSKEDYLASRLQAKVAGLLDSPEEEVEAGNHIKSVERFFALDVNNSGNGSYDEPSDESLSLDFNSTKSIEEFFASDETTTTSGLSMKSEEEQSLGPSVEAFFATEISGPVNGTEAPEEASTEIRGSSEGERITASLEALFEASSESNYGLLSASLEAFFNTDNPKSLLGANEETTLPADETPTTPQLAESATTMTLDRSATTTSLEAAPRNTKNATEEESRATARPDDLFKEKPSQDDWEPTRSAGSIDPADYSALEGAVPTHPLLRRMLTSFRHDPTIEPAEFGKLREPASAYREEPETTDSWERGIDKSLNLASSRSKRTTGGMNKRKRRELGERQYRSF